MSSLKGKVAIFTGTSRGIGSVIAKDLVKEGSSLVVNYSGSKAAAKSVVDEIATAGGTAIAVKRIAKLVGSRSTEPLCGCSPRLRHPHKSLSLR